MIMSRAAAALIVNRTLTMWDAGFRAWAPSCTMQRDGFCSSAGRMTRAAASGRSQAGGWNWARRMLVR